MCKECGCGLGGDDVKIGGHSHDHGHHHDHDHSHGYDDDYDHGGHSHQHGQTVNLNRSLLEKNDRLAERNRASSASSELIVRSTLRARWRKRS